VSEHIIQRYNFIETFESRPAGEVSTRADGPAVAAREQTRSTGPAPTVARKLFSG